MYVPLRDTGSTLQRVGIYSVDGSGNLTLVASTATQVQSDYQLPPTPLYTKALSAAWSKVQGNRYAVGVSVRRIRNCTVNWAGISTACQDWKWAILTLALNAFCQLVKPTYPVL
jgi:hypothetical protein